MLTYFFYTELLQTLCLVFEINGAIYFVSHSLDLHKSILDLNMGGGKG